MSIGKDYLAQCRVGAKDRHKREARAFQAEGLASAKMWRPHVQIKCGDLFTSSCDSFPLSQRKKNPCRYLAVGDTC